MPSHAKQKPRLAKWICGCFDRDDESPIVPPPGGSQPHHPSTQDRQGSEPLLGSAVASHGPHPASIDSAQSSVSDTTNGKDPNRGKQPATTIVGLDTSSALSAGKATPGQPSDSQLTASQGPLSGGSQVSSAAATEQRTEQQDMASQSVSARADDRGPSLHQRLWDKAYDNLKKEDNESQKDADKLVTSYEKILANVLARYILESRAAEIETLTTGFDHKHKDLIQELLKEMDSVTSTNASEKSAEDLEAAILKRLANATERQALLDILVEEGKPRAAKAVKIANAANGVAQTVSFVKPAVDMILQIPQAAPAALPWAGFCLAIQCLSRPEKLVQSQSEGLVHIASKMKWYCAIADGLFRAEVKSDMDTATELVPDILQDKLCVLYAAILSYQMKSVCFYYSSTWAKLTKDKGWESSKRAVESAETTFLEDWDRYKAVQASQYWRHLLDNTRSNMEQLQSIHRTLADDINDKKESHLDEQNNKYLKDLHVVNPAYEMREIENKKGGLCEEVFEWILKEPLYNEFTGWNRSVDSSCRLLWIKAPPGAGKTMLMVGVIRHLLRQPAVLVPRLSYFFCQSQQFKQNENKKTVAIRSLLWMLLVQQPELIDPLRKQYERNGADIFQGNIAWWPLLEAFESILEDVPPIYFLVDALDECQGLSELMTMISTSLRLSNNVRWLVTSRPEYKISQEIRKAALDASGTLCELEIPAGTERVDAYIQHRIEGLRKRNADKPALGYTEEILNRIAKDIGDAADGNLLWVSLVFADIGKQRGQFAHKTIADSGRGLVELYDHKMKKLDEMDSKTAQHCRDVLMIIHCAYRLPLRISELEALVHWSNALDVCKIIEDCDSFLSIYGDATDEGMTVDVIHKSVKDYMDNYWHTNQGGLVKGHADLARKSIDAMTSPERNIFELERWDNYTLAPLRKMDKLVAIEYLCTFWLQHVCDAIHLQGDEELTRESQVLLDVTLQFLRKHFLHWIETIGVLHQHSVGSSSTRKLASIIRSLPKSTDEDTTFMYDAQRFITSHAFIKHPLQTYCAALVFCPTRSKMKELFWEQRPKWIKSVKGAKNDWGPLVHIYYGPDCRTRIMAFSHDGQQIAALSSSSVLLCDVVTGAMMMLPLDHGREDEPEGLVFSSDDRQIALLFRCGGFKLWDLASETELTAPCREHTVRLPGPMISESDPCDKRPAPLPSWVGTELWEGTKKAKAREEIFADSFYPYASAVAFSPDGERVAVVPLASHLDTPKISIRDVATLSLLLPQFQCHNDWFTYALQFSPDSTLLVSAHGGCLKLWDTDVARQVDHSFDESQRDEMMSPFSPDGTLELRAVPPQWADDAFDEPQRDEMTSPFAPDGTLELWTVSPHWADESPAGDRILSTLELPGTNPTQRVDDSFGESHQDQIMSSILLVKVSPNGKYLALATTLGHVWVRDLVEGIQFRPKYSWKSLKEDLAFIFSPNSRFLLSRRKYGTSMLWDLTTRYELLIKGNLDSMQFAFSCDSHQLASASADTVNLWDTATGTEIWSSVTSRDFEPHISKRSPPPLYMVFINSLAFSVDGTLLASGDNRGALVLWDTATGIKLWEISCAYGNAFSPDGKQIATVTSTRRSLARAHFVRLWDAASGSKVWSSFERDRLGRSGLVFSTDGTRLATATEGETITLWDTATGKVLCRLRDDSHAPRGLSQFVLSADGRHLVSMSVCPHRARENLKSDRPGRIELWDVATGTKIGAQFQLDEQQELLGLSSDGRFIETTQGKLGFGNLIPGDTAPPSTPGGDLYADRDRIIQGTREILRLPPGYANSVAVSGALVVIGHHSGFVAIEIDTTFPRA